MPTHPQIASKRDAELEGQILSWIGDVIGEELPSLPYEEVLRDGIVLCKYVSWESNIFPLLRPLENRLRE